MVLSEKGRGWAELDEVASSSSSFALRSSRALGRDFDLYFDLHILAMFSYDRALVCLDEGI